MMYSKIVRAPRLQSPAMSNLAHRDKAIRKEVGTTGVFKPANHIVLEKNVSMRCWVTSTTHVLKGYEITNLKSQSFQRTNEQGTQ